MNEHTSEFRERIERLAELRRQGIERLRTQPSGLEWCREQTAIADEAMRLVVEEVHRIHPDVPPISIVATGGYGRSELAPYSDVDIAIVPLDESHPALDAAVRTIYRTLLATFDRTMGIEVGYAYRLVGDMSGLDPKSRTGLLDARLVAGSHEPFERLMEAFWDSLPVGEFLLEKIEERKRMFAKHHDTPLIVEPHLKEGAGGLRCWHCSNWLDMAVGGRPTRPSRSYDRVLRERNVLHALAGRKLDLLSRTRQGELADMLGREPMAAMSDLVLAMRDLHREYHAALERLHETRFTLSEGVIASRGEVRFFGRTRLSRAAVGVSFATRLGLRVLSLEAPPMTGIEGPEAVHTLCSGAAVLRNLDRCSVLTMLLPELTRCRALMPQDSVHTFTVFEHTLRVVEFIDAIQPGTFLGELKEGLQDLAPLYLAALMHDLGKFVPGRPHEETGAEIAADVLDRWGVREDLAERVVWLVRYHLSMPQIVRMRDVMNPFTAREFAQVVETQDRLDLLTLLTWADISSVSSESWTPVLETFTRELHARTSLILQEQNVPEPTPDPYRRRLVRDLARQELAEEEISTFLDAMPPLYVMSQPLQTVKLHIGLMKKAMEGQSTVDLTRDEQLSGNELTVCTPDRRGLLSSILGVVYAYDLRVHSIRASTTKSDPPIAIDTFHISFGDRPVPDATARQLAKTIRAVVAGETSVEEVLRKRGKDPDRGQRLFSYRFVPGVPGILELQTPRGRGMAYRFTRLITQQGWDILAARVGQWAGRGAAAFYIAKLNGDPVHPEEVRAVFEPGIIRTPLP